MDELLTMRNRMRWTNNYVETPQPQPCAFDKRVAQLGLLPHQYANSEELRAWCKEKYRSCYIPPSLLEAWDLYCSEDYGPTEKPRRPFRLGDLGR